MLVYSVFISQINMRMYTHVLILSVDFRRRISDFRESTCYKHSKIQHLHVACMYIVCSILQN